MQFWFVLRAHYVARFLEPVILRLRQEGHSVRLSFVLPDEIEDRRWAATLDAELIALDADGAPRLTNVIRDLAGYFTLRTRWPPLLRERWLDYFPSAVRRALTHSGVLAPLDRTLGALFRNAAKCIPVPRSLDRQLRRLRPDAVVVTPMIFPGSREIDVVRAAKRHGVPSYGVVLSWDNLTSKGLFHAVPDHVLVWNDEQTAEAMEWHGIPLRRLEALGAPVFDYVFALRGTTSRAETLERLGLAAGDRYLVYGGTSGLGLGHGGEVHLVRELARAVAAAEWSAAPPTILVRPHPKNPQGWDDFEEPGVKVFHRTPFARTDTERRDLVAMLEHAEALVGLNTSLFIDAAIVDTPCIALLLRAGDYERSTPAQLAHFRHLESSGMLITVEGVAAAAEELVSVARGNDRLGPARALFVERFLRPHGVDEPAADVVAQRLASAG